MKNDRRPATGQESDRSLSTPSEANRDKHINYLDDDRKHEVANDKTIRERQERWQNDLHEGQRGTHSQDIY